MPERKVGLIPKVVVSGALGPKEYGVLVTDRRSIFVLERTSSAAIGGAIGGAIGAIIADTVSSTERSYDYENEDPDKLALDEKNVVVPHDQLRRLRIKSHLASCKLTMEYGTPDGKVRKIAAMLTPPEELLLRRKSEGVKGKAVVVEYAKSARGLFELAFPATAAQIGEWMI